MLLLLCALQVQMRSLKVLCKTNASGVLHRNWCLTSLVLHATNLTHKRPCNKYCDSSLHFILGHNTGPFDWLTFSWYFVWYMYYGICIEYFIRTKHFVEVILFNTITFYLIVNKFTTHARFVFIFFILLYKLDII